VNRKKLKLTHNFGGKYAREGTGPLWRFTDKNDGSFIVPDAEYISRLYFPLMNEAGMKCSVTPELKGDICSSFSKYLTVATVTEELHRNISGRNLWIRLKGQQPWSVTGNSAFQKAAKWTEMADESLVEGIIGAFKLERINKKIGLKSTTTVFVPANSDMIEIMKVEIENIAKYPIQLDVVSSLPIFGRHADNIRDHRQVTTMFQYTHIIPHGVRVKPTIVHDERGHDINHSNYVVIGFDEKGNPPEQIWGSLGDFLGEGGTLDNPESVYKNLDSSNTVGDIIGGREAVAALRFSMIKLNPGAKKSYHFLHGITDESDKIEDWLKTYKTCQKVNSSLLKTQQFWQNFVNQVSFRTGDKVFDNWMKWVGFQLKCRQIFGNSYLPDFGYGRGGRGWRDLWQDLLSIFLLDPESAREEMINNFRGVRVDGSNATIIGTKPGEFIADRNNVPRTWCDHGAWPIFALNFYIQQSGDFNILFEELPYWKDMFIYRSKKRDEKWREDDGYSQLTDSGKEYQGSILEHLLIQQLSAFFHVGEHNNLLLEGADWNDTLDMARERGESVCFYNFYGANLNILADLLMHLQNNGLKEIRILAEIRLLLDNLPDQRHINYNSPQEKIERANTYFEAVSHRVSGKTKTIPIEHVIKDLQEKANHVIQHVRKNEWIKIGDGSQFFNGHYDNDGKQVHGDHSLSVRMDLTSQVVPVMCDVATTEQIRKIYKSVKKYLKDEDSPGLRLCTNFKELKLNLGRITGFVYGHKEHGSKWMQQNIMLMYGLYKRNFVKEGFEIFSDVFRLCCQSEIARIFPGVPSYFENGDHGAYAYLTGSSTWLMLTITTQMFGVRGEAGKLCLEPKLSKEQFDQGRIAEICCQFRNKKLRIIYNNTSLKEWDHYVIKAIMINGQAIKCQLSEDKKKALVNHDIFHTSCNKDLNTIEVTLS
jgi:cellobiose phosphorylase